MNTNTPCSQDTIRRRSYDFTCQHRSQIWPRLWLLSSNLTRDNCLTGTIDYCICCPPELRLSSGAPSKNSIDYISKPTKQAMGAAILLPSATLRLILLAISYRTRVNPSTAAFDMLLLSNFQRLLNPIIGGESCVDAAQEFCCALRSMTKCDKCFDRFVSNGSISHKIGCRITCF